MNEGRILNSINIENVSNKNLLIESFKEFVVSQLSDEELINYGKKYEQWFNDQYEYFTEGSKILFNKVTKYLILFDHIDFDITLDDDDE